DLLSNVPIRSPLFLAIGRGLVGVAIALVDPGIVRSRSCSRFLSERHNCASQGQKTNLQESATTKIAIHDSTFDRIQVQSMLRPAPRHPYKNRDAPFAVPIRLRL